MQLMQERILASGTMLMINQQPVETRQAGDFDGHR